MKKSELLAIQADQEENDFRFWALIFESEREARLETFEEKFLPRIEKSPAVKEVKKLPNLYKIVFSDGTKIDLYPKKNRLLINSLNHWKSHAFTWILNKIQSYEKEQENP